jgi:hypothetical protein
MQQRRFAMRSSALFTVIILGAATAVSAEPKQEETSGRVRLDDDQNNKKADAPRQPGDWVELASPTPAKHGTEFVIVGKDAGAFAKLRIDPAKGRTIVRKVKVFFANGKVKTVQLDKVVSQKSKPLFVELGDPKLIDQIVVTTETHTKGQYAIYGSAEVGSGVVSSR